MKKSKLIKIGITAGAVAAVCGIAYIVMKTLKEEEDILDCDYYDDRDPYSDSESIFEPEPLSQKFKKTYVKLKTEVKENAHNLAEDAKDAAGEIKKKFNDLKKEDEGGIDSFENTKEAEDTDDSEEPNTLHDIHFDDKLNKDAIVKDEESDTDSGESDTDSEDSGNIEIKE